MSYYVYILLCSDGSFYTGSTNDIDKRFENHLKGRGARYTKSHKPEKVVYSEKYSTKKEAMKREWQIKKWSRIKKENLIKEL